MPTKGVTGGSTGGATGFVLHIDDDLITKLETADKNIKDLAQQS